MTAFLDSLSDSERAMHYRHMASQTMQLVRLAHNPEAKITLLRLADDWNNLARGLSNDAAYAGN